MTREEVFEFICRHRYAVVATVNPDGTPQSAVVGIAVTKDLEIVFDCTQSSRKYRNLKANPGIAVACWTGEIEAQYEGIAEEATGDDRDRIREIYFESFPNGRDRLSWPGITHFLVRPKWIRYSDFDARPPHIEEFKF
jgi:uncharacterized pyridoxamine 5'-phosphate oxidase family protein